MFNFQYDKELEFEAIREDEREKVEKAEREKAEAEKFESVRKLLAMGLSAKDVAEAMNLSLEVVENLKIDA